MPKQTYLNSDSSYEIIYKNKDNIIDLYAEVNKLKGSSDATIEDLEKLLGNYSQDITGELDTTKSVIENLSIVASNLTSALNRIDAIERQINLILQDGISNYIGTYQATDNNDSSNLPFPASDKDRAITEYVTGDTYKYQEWQFNNGNDDSWSKKGMELDSHIHSQSGGITLDDVVNLQDPKNLKLFFAKSEYIEKEITIPPKYKQVVQDTGIVSDYYHQMSNSLKLGYLTYLSVYGHINPIIDLAGSNAKISVDGIIKDVAREDASIYIVHYYEQDTPEQKITTLVKI